MAGELLALLIGPDKALHGKVVQRIQSIIAASFQQDRSRITRSEVTRRFHIIEHLVRELRADHDWAFDRILDAMPTALRCQLDGMPWQPDLRRNTWTPGNL